MAAGMAVYAVALMASKTVTMTLPPNVEVVNRDITFEVHDGGSLMGYVLISRGGIDWKPVNKSWDDAVKVTWARFAEWIER